MSQKREDADFDSWKKETRAKLDPSVQQAFDLLTGHETSKEVFRGYLREGEFYTRLNEQKAENDRLKKDRETLAGEQSQFTRQRAEIVKWWNDEKPKNARLVEEKKKLEAQVEKLTAKLGKIDPDSTDDGEDDNTSRRRRSEMSDEKLAEIDGVKAQLAKAEARLAQLDENLPGFVGKLGKVIRNSLKENMDVDPEKIVELSLANGTDPEIAYYQLTYEAREKARKEAFDKQLKEAEEKGRREAMSTRPSQDFLRPAGPTVVERIRESKKESGDRRELVNGAVELFRELRSNQAG